MKTKTKKMVGVFVMIVVYIIIKKWSDDGDTIDVETIKGAYKVSH